MTRLQRHPLIFRFSPVARVSAFFAEGNLHLVALRCRKVQSLISV
jgi:hypothetical protein